MTTKDHMVRLTDSMFELLVDTIPGSQAAHAGFTKAIFGLATEISNLADRVAELSAQLDSLNQGGGK